MSAKVAKSDPMLKIVLCEEDDADDIPGEADSCPKKQSDRGEVQSQSSRFGSVRKQNGTRSANYVLASNPYQKKGCGNCQSMQNAKNNVSPFTQKIMSAKLLRFKQMQNQISEMSLKINELLAENKILRTLQRRQDNALKKYEGSKEQLPQMIKSHNEEVRVINMKFKQLKIAHRELENKLKQRDSELMNLREQHSHLLELSRDKHLCEREQLTKKLASLELYSKEQNEKIVTLMRKLELQEKNFKHQLQIETQKHRETQSQLLNARQINSSLRLKEIQPMAKEKVSSPHKRCPDMTYDGFGHRSRASLPSPARPVLIETQRGTVSDIATKSSYSHSNQERDEDSDSAPEERANIKVSVKKAVGNNNKLLRRPLRPPSSSRLSLAKSNAVPSPPTTTDSTESKVDSLIMKLPGRVSLSTNSSDELPPKSAVSASSNGNKNPSPALSPRFAQGFRTGISIPSDLTIGNAARMRAEAIESSDNSEATDDDDDQQEEMRSVDAARRSDERSDVEFDDEKPTIISAASLRARTEEDIDKIISKACDDMLASDLEHETLMNGMGNFSLSEELSQLKDLSWDELQKQIKPMRDEMTRKIEKTMPMEKTDYTLDSHEKNHLLKALNLIDEESKPDIDKFIDDDSFSPSVESGRVRQMFAQNRKKVDLMRSLFGTDVDQISLTDGIN